MNKNQLLARRDALESAIRDYTFDAIDPSVLLMVVARHLASDAIAAANHPMMKELMFSTQVNPPAALGNLRALAGAMVALNDAEAQLDELD